MANEGMVDADYTSVPVGMGTWVVLLQKDHNICMHTRIERVLLSLQVLGCIVDTQDFVLVNLILDKSNQCLLCLNEHDLIGVIFQVKNFAEGVVLEVGVFHVTSDSADLDWLEGGIQIVRKGWKGICMGVSFVSCGVGVQL